MSGLRVPANKMDKQHWENYLSYLEQAQRGQLIANNATAATATDLDGYSSEVPSISTISNTTAADAADLIKRCRLGETENVVVLSSDSENDDETIWSSYAKCKGYKRLWERSRCLVFHRLIPKYHCTITTKEPYLIKTVQEQLFPYNKLKELAEELRKFQQDFMHNEEELKFLWKSVLQWLLAVLQSLYPMDAKYDEKFNLILIDFMVQYVNYITSISSNLAEEAKINARIQEVVQTLTVILSANTLHALMVLLRIDLKLEYRAILDPIFRKYLTEPSLCHASADLVVYLKLIFCFKRWKMITPLKTDRENINELAVGKPLRKLRGKLATEVTDLTTESILPKSVPKVNDKNKFFVSISDLIGFAIERKSFGTRILLVYTSLDLEDAISKYLQFYKRYVSCNPGFGMPDATTTLPIDMDILHQQAEESAFMTYRNNRDASPRQQQQQQQPSQQKNKAIHFLENQPKNSKSSHDTHFDKNCDKNKNRLSYFPSCSVSSLSRKHTKNTQSDISFSSLSTSLNNNTEYTQIDLTDSEDDDREYPKSKQNTTLTNTSGSFNADMNLKSLQPEPQNVKIHTNFSRRHREKKQKTNTNQTTEIKTNTKNTESTIILTSSSSSDDDNSLIKYLKNSDSDTVSRHNSTVPNENALALEQSMPRIAAIPPRCRPLVESVATKPTRKEKHCIPGEVSSTTSPDCGLQTSGTQSPQAAQERETTSSNFQYNVSNLEVHSAGTLQNAREVGIVKAVQQRISPCPPVVVSGTCKPGSLLLGIDYSDFSSDNDDLDSECGSHILAHGSWKVVEEATSSTAEVPKTLPENTLFSTRSDRIRIKSRVNSAEKNSLLKNLPIDGTESQFSAPLSATQDRLESVDGPTCSKYIGKTRTTSEDLQSGLIQRISKDNNNLVTTRKTDSLLPAMIEPNCIENNEEELTVISRELESESKNDELLSKDCEKSVVENLKSVKEKKIDSVATGDEISGVVAGIIEVSSDCQINITNVIPVHCKEKVLTLNQIGDNIIRTEEVNAVNEASHSSITSSDPFTANKIVNPVLNRTSKEQNKLLETSFNERGTKQSPFKPNIDPIALKSKLVVQEDGKIPSEETDESAEAADIESLLKEIDENLKETTVISNNNKDRCKEVQPDEIIKHDSNLDEEAMSLIQEPISKSSPETNTHISQSTTTTTEPSETPMSVDTNFKTTEDLSREEDPLKKCVPSNMYTTKDSSEKKEIINDRETVESLKSDNENNEPSVIDKVAIVKNEAVLSVTPVEIEKQIDANKILHDNLVSINMNEKSNVCASEVEGENMENTEKSSNIMNSKEDQNSDKPLPTVLVTEIATAEAKISIPTKDSFSLNVTYINEVLYLNEQNSESKNATETKSNDDEVLRPLNDKSKISDTNYLDVTEIAKKINESNKDEELLPLSHNNKVSDNVHQDICEHKTNTDIVKISSINSSLECREKADIKENEILKEVEWNSPSIAFKNVDKINEPEMNTNDKFEDEFHNNRIELSTNEYEDTNTITNTLKIDDKGMETGIGTRDNETCVSESAKAQLQNPVDPISEVNAGKSELEIKSQENNEDLISGRRDKYNKVCLNVAIDYLDEQELKTAESVILTKPDISEENMMKTNATNEDVNPIVQNFIAVSKKMCNKIHENQEVPSIQLNSTTEIKNVNENIKSKEEASDYSIENQPSEPTKPIDVNDSSGNITAIELCNSLQLLTLGENKNIIVDVESSIAGDIPIETSSNTKDSYSFDVQQSAKSQNEITEDPILPSIKNKSNNYSLSSSEVSLKIIAEINSASTELPKEKVCSSETLNSEKPCEEIKVQQDSNKSSLLEDSAELKTTQVDENNVEVWISEKVEEKEKCREISENTDGKTFTDTMTQETVNKIVDIGEELNKSSDSDANSDGTLIVDNLILKCEGEKNSDILNSTKDETIHIDDRTDQVLVMIPQNRDETSINSVESAITITDETGTDGLNLAKDVMLSTETATTLGEENDNPILEKVAAEKKQKHVFNAETIIRTKNSADNNEILNNYKESPSKEIEDKKNKIANTIEKLCEDEIELSNSKKEGPTNELDNQRNNADKTITELCEEEQNKSKEICNESSSQEPKPAMQENILSTLVESENIINNENKSQSEQTSQQYNDKDVSENVQSTASTTELCGSTSYDTSEKSFENEDLEMDNVLEHSQSSKGSNASGRGTPLLDEELNSLHGTEDSATLKNTVSTVFKSLKEHSCTSKLEKIEDDCSKIADNVAEIKSTKPINKIEVNNETNPKILSSIEDDLEKRTPWKMRIKRRISQCSDINKEFNLDNEEVEEKHKEIAFQEPLIIIDNNEIVNYLASPTVTKDADELAINISKLNIKSKKTRSESDQSQAENDGDDLQNSLLSNLGLFKRSRSNLAPETILPNDDENKDALDKFEGRRKKQRVVKHVFEDNIPPQPLEQMPINYNFEEIAAITALMNMQNKCSKKNDDNVPDLDNKDDRAKNATPTETRRHSRLCKSKAQPRNCASQRSKKTTNTTTTTTIATEPIKPILKSTLQSSDSSSKCKNKKKVTYDEASILRLEKNSETRKARKAYNNLKILRSEEGALLKGGNRYTKKRLAEINARLEQDTMGGIEEFNESSCNSVTDHSNETCSMALRNKCKISEMPEQPPPLPRRKSLEYTVSRLAERIKCQNINVDQSLVCNTTTPESSDTTLEHSIETIKPRRGRKKKITHESTADKSNQIMTTISEDASSSKSPCPNKNIKQDTSAGTVYPVRLTTRKLARNSNQNNATKPNNAASMPMPPSTVPLETPIEDSKIPTFATEPSVVPNIEKESNIVQDQSQVASFDVLSSYQSQRVGAACDMRTPQKIKDSEIKSIEQEPEADEEPMTKSKDKSSSIQSESRKNSLKFKRAFVKMKRLNMPEHTASSSQVVSTKTEDTSSMLQESQIKKEPREESVEPPSCNNIDFEIKTEEESLDAIDKFSQMQNDFSFIDTDAEIEKQKSCKEIIVRPCDVILTADIINAQAIRLTEIAREKRKLKKITYCDTPSRRKTVISPKATGKKVSTIAKDATDLKSTATTDNKIQEKIPVKPKGLKKIKPLCKHKQDLEKEKAIASVENVCENKEKENVASQILNDCIESDKITLRKAAQTIPTELDVCQKKENKTSIKKDNATTPKVSQEMMETDDITSTKCPKAIPSQKTCEKKEKETSMKQKDTVSQTLSHAKIESDNLTSVKDLKNLPTKTLCENKEMENTSSQMLTQESIKSDDITSANDLENITSKNIYQNKKKKALKKSNQILSNPSIQPVDIIASNTLKTLSTENICENKEPEDFLENENTPRQNLCNKSIKFGHITLPTDLKTTSNEEAGENRIPNILLEMENATSQELRNESIESDDITAKHISENINQNKRKKKLKTKKSTSSQILSHESIKSNDITATIDLNIKFTKDICENKEKQALNDKKNTPSQTMGSENIESGGITSEFKTISTEEICENRETIMLLDIDNSSSQTLRNENIELKTKPIIAVFENKETETLNEKENINNKSIESGGISLTKNIKTTSTEEVCKNRETKMLEDIENSGDIISANDLNITPSESICQNKSKITLKAKKSTSNQILNHETTISNDIAVTTDRKTHPSTEDMHVNTVKETMENNDLIIVVTTDVCESIEKETLMEKEITPNRMLSNKSIETDDVTKSNDLENIPTYQASENREKETFTEKGNKSNYTISSEIKKADDIKTFHEKETLPSEHVHQAEKEEKKSSPSQELNHDTTLTNDLKNKPFHDVCENKERKTFVAEDANTSGHILSNENTVSNKIKATKDLKVMSSDSTEDDLNQKTSKEISTVDIESEESADKITECVIAELKLLSPQNMLQELSQPEFDPDVEIAKKLDQGIEMVLGNKIENKSQQHQCSGEKRNSIDDKEQKTAELLDSAIEKVLGNSAATSKPTIQMTTVENHNNKQTYQPKTTTEHIDFAIDAILGAKNASKPDSVVAVVEENKIIPPTKRKLGILTAEKINSSIEKLLENNRRNDLEHKTAETLNQSIEKILGQRIAPIKLNEFTTIDATTQSLPKKSSPKPEDVTAKKSMSKKYFTDMKIVSANVPEALFADDDSDNSNSGENSSPDNLKFFPPILSLDDLLHKKTDQILQIPCCANSDNCNCSRQISDTAEEPTIGGSRQYLGTPNFAIELEVETSTKSNTNEENCNEAAGENGIENVSNISDTDTEEIPTNLVEANTTNVENFVLSDISAIGIPIDFNMTNESFPDVMDIMLLDQVQQSIDCVISGNNYVQKWSQESYSTQAAKKNLVEKGRDKDPVPSSVPSEQHNICISQILESNSSSANSSCANTIGIDQGINYSTISPLDEVEVSTNIGFDLVGNVTVEDLLADDGDDLFAFPELDKSRSRCNSYSNDSESYSNSTNEAIENMALTTKIIACDHSYNKEIEEKESNESCNEQNTIESPNPIISLSPNLVTIGKTIPPEVKNSPSHNFTKLKSHPTPYWSGRKIKKVDLKTSTPKRSSSFDEHVKEATATNTSDKVNSVNSSTLKAELSHVQKKLFYNMPELDLAPSKSESKCVLPKSESLPSKPVIPIENPTNTDIQNEVQKIVQSIVESSALQEVVPKRLTIEITEMVTIPAPSPISQETITTTIDESQVSSEIEQEKSSSRSSTPTEISDTTAPAPAIITQPIITIQSQTNRLQRMDSISNNFQGSNDYNSFPSSTLTSSASVNCTPNREPTPTLDEPTKEEISLDDTTEQLSDELVEDTSEKNVDIISLKRGSTPTMDEPPEKKLCLDKSPKQHSSKDDIFDMLKREPLVNAVVCKPIVEQIVKSEGSKEELLTEALPVRTEEPKKETKQECNSVELQDITKETTSTKGEGIYLKVKPIELTKKETPEDKSCSKEAKPKEIFSESGKETNVGAEKSMTIIEYKCSLIDTVVNGTEAENKTENNCTSLKRLNSSATSIKPSIQKSPKISTKPIPNISVAALPKIVKLKDNSNSSSSTSKQDFGNLNRIKPIIKPTELDLLTKKMPTTTTSSKKSPYTVPSAKKTTSPSSSKTPPAPSNRPHPYNNSPNNVKVNRNKYSYQRVDNSTDVKYPTKCINVPNALQHKQTSKPTPDKKSYQNISNSGNKPTPTLSHSNLHKNSTNSGPITAANIKLSAADEAELKAKLDAYQKTLPQTKIYKEHREQLRLLKLQEEKLRLEYLEREKRRQAQKLMLEAQRLKRKSCSESYEAHYKKFALSSAPNVSTSNSMPPHHPHQHSHKQPHNRQKYVNKFGEIEKNVASSRNNKEIVPSKAPLTITTAWEHKSASVDEIIEHLAKMKKS